MEAELEWQQASTHPHNPKHQGNHTNIWTEDAAKVTCVQEKAHFQCWPFPRGAVCSRPSLMMGLARAPSELAVRHVLTDTLTIILDQTLTLPSCSVLYSMNYMRESTLYYKTGSVLDCFAQL